MTMDKLYQDTMTPQMRHDLALHFYEMGFITEPEPTYFTQVTDADQDAPQPNYSPLAIPDRHYYDAAGQVPPQEPEAARTFREVLTITMILFFIGEIILLCAGV